MSRARTRVVALRSRLVGLAVAAAWLGSAAPAMAQDRPPQRYDSQGRPIPGEPEAPPPNVELPEPLLEVDPVYPPAAKEAGIEGEVVLKLKIDTHGLVAGVEVLASGGNGFDEAATEAARKMRFTPALRDGVPFPVAIRYAFRFKIEERVVEQPAAPTVGALSGRVLLRDIEAPLAGVSVTLTLADGSTRQATTGADGSFRFPDLPESAYAVTVSAPGYGALSVEESVEAGQETVATYRLATEASGDLLEVVVGGERPPREVTKRTLERREIDRVAGTQGDALKAIQNLPGLARTPAIVGALLVRGSAPQDTLTFVDGIYVPLIYHFGGLSSVVPTELLDRIDFYPGNFSARYGRAQGGVVDAGIRSPKDDGYHGLAQFDLIDARLMLEGPIPFVDGWTFAAAGRRSWLDAWLGPVLQEAGAAVSQAPRYYDYQFMIDRRWDEGHVRVSFYGTDDSLELLLDEPAAQEPALSGNLGLRTAFQRAQLGYDQRLSSDDEVKIDFALGRDTLGFNLGSLFFELDVLSVSGRAEYTRRLGKRALLHLGLDMFGGQADVNARLPAPPQPGSPPNQPFSTRNVTSAKQTQSFYRPAAYVEAEITPVDRWRIVPGLRVDYSRDTESWTANPRINSRFQLIDEFPKTTLKGGVGVYSQPPQFGQSVPPLGTAGIRSNQAIHYGLGVEQDITKQLEVGLEGFYKQLENQVIGGATVDGAVDYSNVAFGYAGGAELLLKYKPDDRFFGWLAYTLSRSQRQNGPDDDPYLVIFDQTHVLTVLGSYRLGHGWEIGARFRLTSGNLLTPNVCDFTSEACDPKRIGGLFHAASGAYTAIPFDASSSERLPLFHQLDIRVDKKWAFKDWSLSAYLDVQNVYNHLNVEGISYNFNFSARQYVTGIPILPSIGLRAEFDIPIKKKTDQKGDLDADG